MGDSLVAVTLAVAGLRPAVGEQVDLADKNRRGACRIGIGGGVIVFVAILVMTLGSVPRADLERIGYFRNFPHLLGTVPPGSPLAGLHVAARDESPTSPYRYAREVFLRLEPVL